MCCVRATLREIKGKQQRWLSTTSMAFLCWHLISCYSPSASPPLSSNCCNFFRVFFHPCNMTSFLFFQISYYSSKKSIGTISSLSDFIVFVIFFTIIFVCSHNFLSQIFINVHDLLSIYSFLCVIGVV